VAHLQQIQFCQAVKIKYPKYFKDRKVLDVGSLDINGCNRYLFDDCIYFGLDIAEGKNVDIVCKGHEYAELDESYDTIISTECFEHDMFYEKTLQNIVRLLRPGGLFIFTCATTGREEHGTARTAPFTSPFTSQIPEWANYYKNLTEEDVRKALNIEEIFKGHQFLVKDTDLQFIGFKKDENTK
jgi:SAM-dependent methyltransferase